MEEKTTDHKTQEYKVNDRNNSIAHNVMLCYVMYNRLGMMQQGTHYKLSNTESLYEGFRSKKRPSN